MMHRPPARWPGLRRSPGLLLGALLAFLWGSGEVRAQVQVDLSFARTLYIRYEPLIATVTIANLSGRPLLLSDSPEVPWFGFQIESQNGRLVTARGSAFGRDPVAIGPGETLRRTVNLTPLYRLDDFGRYTVRASVFDASLNRYFSSPPRRIEITEGRALWQQIVGHPIEGTSRQVTLLSHRLTNFTAAYLRILDPDRNTVYCTHRLGPIVSYGIPKVELDANNEVHVLQMSAPRTFVYSHIGLNGEVHQRQSYSQTTNTRPSLQRTEDGRVMVVGGAIFSPEVAEAEAAIPGVSDRPVPIAPAAPPDSSPAASPEPRRPGLNLWPFGRRQPSTE